MSSERIRCTAYGGVKFFKEEDESTDLVPVSYDLPPLGANDVIIKVMYCGICHSDVHILGNDLKGFAASLPVVPGHEITGIVHQVGSSVTKYKQGDRVGVGCIVNTCGCCVACGQGRENCCNHQGFSYGGTYEQPVLLNEGDKSKHVPYYTQGGYGSFVICKEHCVLSIPEELPLDRAAPLLCAGITVWTPLCGIGAPKGGMKIGVVGLGGLGHMAVQLAISMGNQVYVISRTKARAEDAKQFGAVPLALNSPDEMDETLKKSGVGILDAIIDTTSGPRDVSRMLGYVKVCGTYILVGATNYVEISLGALVYQNKTIKGSTIGSIKETQEMLEYCAKARCLPQIESINLNQASNAYRRILKSDVKFRFVIDVSNSSPKESECYHFDAIPTGPTLSF